ncbi:MAG TPA: AraC family transcriptional regulator [Candidatus Accumulibacter phosphatis]|nr:MAG: Urease operon transcriptional activator [Candidatus Accumulibacter sp. SK-11]HAY27383.1 AraC family transcriptional regulator [Accumulibacter sp.]HRL78196.1 AraC family transcriptional regulator [Candidatus Accumulibacter phosphatis]HCN69934.1 AraC family transcriptional regulator [Accumulibacter sp.]HCV13491.1 AraC family transcriptional regulator [Accumulibacter sp.]
MPYPEKTANGRRATGSASVAAPARATVAIAFVQGMLAGLVHAGRATAPLLERAHIASQMLSDPQARVPIERYAELYNLVNRELDDEGFALFSQPIRIGTFEFLCRSVITAPTLATAIDRGARFVRLVLPDLAVRLDCHDEQACLCISENQPLVIGRVFAFEWLLRLLHGLFSWLVGRSIVFDSVAFPYPRPQHAADYALIYTAQSSFDASELAAVFAANLLDLPIRRDEAALQAFLDGAPGKLTTLYRRDREMVLRVRNALRDALPVSASLADVARSLHLSQRTLHRRLLDEGSSFQAIKDALRHDLAINRLAKSRQGLAQLAAELGFADTAAFYRAFLRWTGMGPAHYRRRLLAAGDASDRRSAAAAVPD